MSGGEFWLWWALIALLSSWLDLRMSRTSKRQIDQVTRLLKDCDEIRIAADSKFAAANFQYGEAFRIIEHIFEVDDYPTVRRRAREFVNRKATQ